MTDGNKLHNVICNTISQVIRDSGRSVDAINNDDSLRETLALDSLDLAVIVVRLEQQIGIDPFRQHRQAVKTVSDFVTVYQQAVAAQ